MYLILFLLFLHSIQLLIATDTLAEKPITIIIPSYNNVEWYTRNLDSVYKQKYKNYRVIYLNDASKDGLKGTVQDYLKKEKIDHISYTFDDSHFSDIPSATKAFQDLVNQEKHFTIVINNQNRTGALANLYRAIQSTEDQEIIVTVDGDDWLYDENVLKLINETYSSADIWLTHGNLVHYPVHEYSWCEAIPDKIIKTNTFRSFKCPSHLRTFYSWLFKKIKLEDLLYEGKFYQMTWDMAMMYPMIEMAGDRHAFITQPTYVYNVANQINDNKVNAELQQTLDTHIRNLPPYSRLEKPQ